MADLILTPGDFVVVESSIFMDRDTVAEVIEVYPATVGLRRVRSTPLRDGDEDPVKRRRLNAVKFAIGRDRSDAVRALNVIDAAITDREEAISAAKLAYGRTVRALKPATPEKSA